MKYFPILRPYLFALQVFGISAFPVNCEEWKEFPTASSSVTSLALVGKDIFGNSEDMLMRFSQGNFAKLDDSVQPSPTGWYPEKLFSDGQALFIDRLVYTGSWPSFQIGKFETLRYKGRLSTAPIQGQLMYMDDTVAYSFSGNRFLQYRETQSEILIDTLHFSNTQKMVSDYGGMDYVDFFLPDLAGGFWFSVTHVSDGREPRGLYRFDPKVSNKISSAYPESLDKFYWNDGAIDASGKVYFGTYRGLWAYESGAWKDLTSGESALNKEVAKVFVDSRNTVWFGTGSWDSVFQIAAIKNGKIEVMKTFSLQNKTGGITDIMEDGDGNIWFSGINIPVQVYNENKVTMHLGRMTRFAARNSKSMFSFGGIEYGKQAYNLLGRRHSKINP